MRRIILDTDIGTDVDDAMALTLALRSPELKLEAVTTVYGDVDLRSRMALKLMRLAGVENIPVASGISRPLLRNREVWWAGHEGVGLLTEEDQALMPSDIHAVDLIISQIMANPGEITLVPIGPLTNIAAAIIKEPRLIENAAGIIMMGGVARIFDNAPLLPPIEHNIRCDPEAAAVVFESGIPITMVGLDVTVKVKINSTHLQRIKETNTPLTDALGRMIEKWWEFIGANSSPMHDPLAVATCISPDLIKTLSCKVLVETQGKHTTGQTLAIPDVESRIRVASDVNSNEFLNILMSRVCQNSDSST